VAVVFDTCNVGSPSETDNNHVAILTDRATVDLGSQSPYGLTDCNNPTGVFGCLGNGDIWSIWIDYDGTYLYVAVADKSVIRPPNLIIYPIDIGGWLGRNSAYVGFTAATGNGWETHSVINWAFSQLP